MMTTALAVVQPEHDTFTRQQLDLIKTTLAAGLTDNEFALYIEVAKRTGLDPLSRQIYAIKRGDKMTIQTGIDGYRAIASRTGLLAGIDDAVYDTEDADHPGRASVTVWRFAHGERVPFTATARWSEYKPDHSPMWARMPYLMLGKCAEALALRKAFPVEIAGVYTADEMAQAENESYAPTREVVTDITHTPLDPARQPRQAHTWEDVTALATKLKLAASVKKALHEQHGDDPDAIYKAMEGLRPPQKTQDADMAELPVGAKGN